MFDEARMDELEAQREAVMRSFVIISMHPKFEDLQVLSKGVKTTQSWLQYHQMVLPTRGGNIAYYETEALAEARVEDMRINRHPWQTICLKNPHEVRIITYREFLKLTRQLRRDGQQETVRNYLNFKEVCA